MSEKKSSTVEGASEPPPFAWSSLWKRAEVNPLNLKSYTLPILNLRDPYARSFHLYVDHLPRSLCSYTHMS